MEVKIETMSIDLIHIELIADQIVQKLNTGEIHEGCCMSAASSPVTEAWDKANELAEKANIAPAKKKSLLNRLGLSIQTQLESTGYDDFDLIYELILQLVNEKKKGS